MVAVNGGDFFKKVQAAIITMNLVVLLAVGSAVLDNRVALAELSVTVNYSVVAKAERVAKLEKRLDAYDIRISKVWDRLTILRDRIMALEPR